MKKYLVNMLSNDQLTNRELATLKLLAKGLSDREVAEQLDISIATVKVHNRNLYRKLNVRNRAEAVRLMLS